MKFKTIDNKEKPLLIAKYTLWRRLLTILIHLVGTIVFSSVAISCFHEKTYLCSAFTGLVGMGAIFFISDSLLTKDFLFFGDRIAKRRFMFDSRTMYFNELLNLDVLHRVLIRYMIFSVSSSNRRFPKISKAFFLNMILLSNDESKKIIEFLSKISNRDIDELDANGSMIPFINKIQ